MRTLARTSLSLLALVAVAAMPSFGPPRITVKEVVGTPPTPGAVLAIEGHHHTDEAQPDVSGRAEGMRNGQRVSQRLTLTPARERGHFGVTRQWDAGTPWVLVFTIRQGDHGQFGSADALVKIDATGKVVGIETPMERNARGDAYPRSATPAEVDAALTALSPRR